MHWSCAYLRPRLPLWIGEAVGIGSRGRKPRCVLTPVWLVVARELPVNANHPPNRPFHAIRRCAHDRCRFEQDLAGGKCRQGGWAPRLRQSLSAGSQESADWLEGYTTIEAEQLVASPDPGENM
jgi:hypothetical protein